jgi:serine/threonine-protein kinase
VTDFIGQTIHGYHIVEQVMLDGGGGGFRAVREHDALPVLVRVLLPRFYASLNGFIKHFDAEFSPLTTLLHPCVVPVYDFWHDNSGAYLVSGFMAGGDLSTSMLGQRLNDEAIDALLERITAALDMLHMAGFVHQDIRPGAIALDDHQDASLMVMETVLNRLINRSSPQLWTGVPEYASPEQTLGKRLDAQSDIYSLGMLLYELLTGRKPFGGAAPYEVLLHQLHDPLPPLRKDRPDLPAAVNKVIQRATAKHPDSRYASAGEMFNAWRAATAG